MSTDTCEHCSEDRNLHQLDEDNPRSPWVCETCSNILDKGEMLGKPSLLDDMAALLTEVLTSPVGSLYENPGLMLNIRDALAEYYKGEA